MGLGERIKSILPTRSHHIECPVCGHTYRTQALYEDHYYKYHADTPRFK